MNTDKNQLNSPANRALAKGLVALAAAVAIVIYLFWFSGIRHRPEASSDTPAPRLTTGEKAAFFAQNVSPILDVNASANIKALETLRADIHQLFEQYRAPMQRL